MFTVSSLWSKILLFAGLAFAVLGSQGTLGQEFQGQYPQSGEDRGNERSQSQVQADEPFIHGVSLGAGLAIYQGDLSRNPNHNIIKYIAGSGSLALRAGADHRLGLYDQYGLGADLVYNRLSGKTTGDLEFKADAIALDFYADYELPYIRQGLFRVFVGGGPNFIISPSYKGFPEEDENENFEKLGTRVTGSLKVGVTILDGFRIGTRIASTDLLDGYKGFTDDGLPDFVSFVNFSYRFDLKY